MSSLQWQRVYIGLRLSIPRYSALKKLPFIPGVNSNPFFLLLLHHFLSKTLRNMLANRWITRAAQGASRLSSVRLLSLLKSFVILTLTYSDQSESMRPPRQLLPSLGTREAL